MRTSDERKKDAELERASAALVQGRDSLVRSIGALADEITRTLDWRAWVRRKPGTVLALAFGLGLFLGRRP